MTSPESLGVPQEAPTPPTPDASSALPVVGEVAASEIESSDALIDFISDALDNAADYDMGWRDYAKRVAQALVAANAVRFT